MRKVYLAKCMATMALGFFIAGCSSDDVSNETKILTEEEALENAEAQLGITIDPNQTWQMTQQVTANVTINEDYGETYTVRIYQDNPLINNEGVLLAEGEVQNGETFTSTFSTSLNDSLFAAYVDKKGYIYVKPAVVKDSVLNVVFGETSNASQIKHRTSTNGFVNIPTTTNPASYAASLLTDAIEANNKNIYDNYNNSYYKEGELTITTDPVLPNFNLGSIPNNLMYNSQYQASDSDRSFYTNTFLPLYNQYNAMPLQYNGKEKVETHNAKIDKFYELYNAVVQYAGQNGVSNWLSINGMPTKGAYTISEGYWVLDEDYVTKFKITGNFDKIIDVLATEESNGDARTVYVTGKWTIPEYQEQRVGGGGVVVVGDGGEIDIKNNAQLNFVNQSRLIVLPGGIVKGDGAINITNGVKEGEECYNGGTIRVKTINQNYGNFFNYGTITSETLIGGAGTSCFVNHGKIKIEEAYGNNNSAANLQIKNNCWFEAEEEVACKILENGANAYFKCQDLEMSGGEGGEGLGSYLAADNSSMVRVTDEVQLNGTLIIGPTSGNRAYIEFDEIEYLNVGMTYPIMNNLNLYVGSFDKKSYKSSWNTNMNADGNGNAQMVGKAAFNTASTEASECAPAFTPGTPITITSTYPVYSYAFEDTKGGDYDMNDVVIKVQETNNNKIKLTIVAVGATLDLNIRLYEPLNWRNFLSYVFWGNYDYQTLTYNGKSEVHEMFGAEKGTMINTGKGAIAEPITITIDKKNGFFSRSYDPANLPLAIYSESQGEMNLAITGQAPYGIIIPGNWSWPKEQVRITTAYPHFSSYAADMDSDIGWFNYENPNSVMNESTLGF